MVQIEVQAESAPDDKVMPLARRKRCERRGAVVVQRSGLPVSLQLCLAEQVILGWRQKINRECNASLVVAGLKETVAGTCTRH